MRNAQLLLQRPDGGVGGDNGSGQQHLGLVVGGDGRQEGRVGGFDAAPKAAPEIDFPGGRGAQAVLPEIRGGAAAFRWRDVGSLAGRNLDLRVLQAGGDAKLGPGFQHAQPRDLQRVVVAPRAGDQFVQHGVVEYPPPLDQFVGRGPHPFVRSLGPLLRRLQFRLDEIRPDRAGRKQHGEQACGRAGPVNYPVSSPHHATHWPSLYRGSRVSPPS